jgi:hypothetical protein
MIRIHSYMFVAVLFLYQPGYAQTTVSAHNHDLANIIDGSVTPDAIPDMTAYRLYMAMVSRASSATDGEKKQQSAQLAKVGLQRADRDALLAVLVAFNSQYRNLIQSYNDEAKASSSRGDAPDQVSFLLQRDQIVRSAHDTLKATLSPDGWSRLDAFVKEEKKMMKVSVQEVEQ